MKTTHPYYAVIGLAALLLTACPDSGMPGAAPVDTPPPLDTNTGTTAIAPQSIFITSPDGTGTQVFRMDVEPNTTSAATKGVATAKGLKVKTPSALHMKYNKDSTLPLTITPYGEAVVTPTNADSHFIVGLMDSKQQFTTLLQHKKVLSRFYVPALDQLLFITWDGTNRHLMLRDMAGKETEILKDTSLTLYTAEETHTGYMGAHVVVNGPTIGSVLINLTTLKTTSLPGLAAPIDHNKDFWFVKKDAAKTRDLFQISTQKSWPLVPDITSSLYSELLKPDLQEFVFRVGTMANNVPHYDYKSINLRDGSIKTIYSTDSALSKVIDHIGDNYLVSSYDVNGANSLHLSWLKPDGSLSDIASFLQGPATIVGYNPNNGTVLVNAYFTAIPPATSKHQLALVSTKDGKAVTKIDYVLTHTTSIWPMTLDWPVLLVRQDSGTAGTHTIGLLSPDTLGGDSGTEINIVPLGTIPSATGTYNTTFNLNTQDLKTRSAAIVPDTTPPMTIVAPKITVGTITQPTKSGDSASAEVTIDGDDFFSTLTTFQCTGDFSYNIKNSTTKYPCKANTACTFNSSIINYVLDFDNVTQAITCSVDADNTYTESGGHVTDNSIKINSPATAPGAAIEVRNVPPVISITGNTTYVIKSIYIYDSVPNTTVDISCTLDKMAKVVPDGGGATYNATITAQAGDYNGKNDDACTVSAKTPDGYSSEEKLVLHSLPPGKYPPTFIPNNFKGDIPLVAQPSVGYYAVADATKLTYPKIEISDPDGLKSITLTCSDNNKLGLLTATTQWLPGTVGVYQLTIRYNIGSAPAGGFVAETCTLAATDNKSPGLSANYYLTLKPQ